MKTKSILLLTAAALVTACGGSTGGQAVNPLVEAPIVEAPIVDAPVALRKVELIDATSFEVTIAQLDEAEKGDYFDIPSSLFGAETESTNVRLVIGDMLKTGKKIVYSILPEIDQNMNAGREFFVYDTVSDAFTALGTNFNDAELVIDSNSEKNISISSWSGDSDYRSLYADIGSEEDYAYSDIQRFSDDGRTVYGADVGASSDTFNRPEGEFIFSGRTAVQWAGGTKIAKGDVRMTATFGNTASSATIVADNLAGEGATAEFSGSLAIDNATGTYASTAARLKVGDTSLDAGILGIFNGDATLTAGTIFDENTSGEQAAGVFVMSRD